jgi:hypothetical protein
MLSQFSESSPLHKEIKHPYSPTSPPLQTQPFHLQLNHSSCCVQALVFEIEEFSNLSVPLPAVLQVQA